MATLAHADLVDFSSLPNWVEPVLTKQLALWEKNLGCHWQPFCQHIKQQHLSTALSQFLICSDYVSVVVRAEVAALFVSELAQRRLEKTIPKSEIHQRLQQSVQSATTENDFMQSLRVQRKLFMSRSIWREFGLQIDPREVMLELSNFAEVCIQKTVIFVQQQLQKKYGLPDFISSPMQPALNVIAMGKLGAYELNLSSDIDLIFCFSQDGNTSGGDEAGISHARYFDMIARRLIRILDAHTADGFVFRVDMRLRPFGEAGALVWQKSALLDYYQNHGRDWERYAMIRARMVCGPKTSLLQLLDPFVYRGYGDFGVIQSLQEMKTLINKQVQIQKLNNDIKLGQGGIREIEFVVQALQLVRGGRETNLKTASLPEALAGLSVIGDLSTSDACELESSYFYLRHVEHGIQALADQQTQQLPKTQLAQQRLAWVVAQCDWLQLCETLADIRQQVSIHFANTVSNEEMPRSRSEVSLGWRQLRDNKPVVELDKDLLSALNSVVSRVKQRHDDEMTWQRLDAFMPLWLTALNEIASEHRAMAMQRSMAIIVAILGRSTYLLLMTQKPSVLKLMLRFCASSAWVAEQLRGMPILLEELSSVAAVANTPNRAELIDSLRQHLLRVASDDLETQMDLIRYFKAAKTLSAVCAELLDLLPLTQVSDLLSYIAEAVLHHAYALAYQEMLAVYGQPCSGSGEAIDGSAFIIIAYGKLGGLELGFGSDLDLVFVHDSDAKGCTNHPQKPVSNAKFYARLGQRIIHIMSAATQFGQLYEVDMRLRPSGASGVLVTSITALQRYQEQQAWTWEHQALVRARVIAGDGELGQRFLEIRESVVRKPRPPQQLREQVVQMRQRMRKELGGAQHLTEDQVAGLSVVELKKHIKHGAGGMVDLEFMVQYLTLRAAAQHRQFKLYTDNLRLLRQLVKIGVVDNTQADKLIDAYQWQRQLQHHLSLQQPVAESAKRRLFQLCQYVHVSWSQITRQG